MNTGRHFFKSAITLFASVLLIGINSFAGDHSEPNKNTVSINLDKASVNVKYISLQDPKTSDMLTLSVIHPAHFEFSKNMVVNGTHIRKGKYEVSLIEFKDGIGFNFHSTDDPKILDTQVALDERKGTYTEFINYSLQVIEDDKIAGELNWKESTYLFTMEVSLSNALFSYLEKEERENTTEWIDYYQVAIYAYKNNIDIVESYQLAQKALNQESNEYTQELNRMYLDALDQENAQQLSALQD